MTIFDSVVFLSFAKNYEIVENGSSHPCYCIFLSINCFQYLKLRALQRQSYTHYFYEATVGAGLPIISTLRGLLETGDKILRIEGIFRFVSL